MEQPGVLADLFKKQSERPIRETLGHPEVPCQEKFLQGSSGGSNPSPAIFYFCIL